MDQPTVLISGAGVAGPALAYWLIEYGYRTILVESAPEIRPGGQTVDLRGAGRDVVTRMGLMGQMRTRSLAQRGIAWLHGDGRRRAEMPVEAFGGNGVVSKLEILRGDLVEVLYNATKGLAEYRFGTRITAIDSSGATLSDGTRVIADLIVGADGPHSAVRRLVFGPEEQFVTPLGGYNAWFTAADTVGLDGWYLMYQEPGLNASMRPSHDPARCNAGLAFRSNPIGYDRRDPAEQLKLLTTHFAGAGWQCQELLAAATQAEDFYFDEFLQIHMTTISQGRVTLVGDAGCCASPLSGMGTSLALVGAYVLAGELGPADTFDSAVIPDALARYEATMRPYIRRCQQLPNGVDGYLPKSPADIAITAQVMKWMQRPPFRSFAERKWFTVADAIELPDYPGTGPR
ncbi:FAD-dependent monooxygenase [Mycolicibacterium sp. CBMA 295]|uniref:FAD-dependent monooxygenase n=1 Tax=Mycolicibacterium sp. CBMA 295 TaxID=2606605 RepID=UPI0012DED89E|nr:FAD-dependent monooxygenase [Mycolicibacterium sp. CBMA 295]MUM27975.1 FAD-binding monooxygenase [Mycolicibacterium sp. CBMA 295]